MSYVLDLVYPFGEPSINGTIKQNLADFQVFETLGFEPTGDGEHLYLYIEKKDITTDSVTQSLARHYGVKPYHIGDCGLKDAKAVTRQWFSVHLPGLKDFPNEPINEDYKVLERNWSLKKLKKGVHKGNSFIISLTNIQGDIDKANHQIEQIKQQGFANYYGEQRFGKGKKNVSSAMDAFKFNKKLSRSKRSLYLSSLRSFLFNKILLNRITKDHWDEPIEGDCFMLDGSKSTFIDEISDQIISRYKEGDIHSIISLFGEGDDLVSRSALSFEISILDGHKDIQEVLLSEGLKKDKRAIRQNIKDLTYSFENNTLTLKFYLPKGCYATTLMSHFCHLRLP